MSSTFNPQILTEKLAKLNSSQQSIETLSHWCIFHMNKAKFVVDTWAYQFHSSARDQRISFLYLANDILQNSRRKGFEFVTEFWRVLPDALRDVMLNGDDAGKKAARRLISIWDERNVFGERGHILIEEFVSTQSDNSNQSGRQPNLKSRQAAGTVLDKVVSGYEMLHGGELDEDAVLSRCTSAISTLQNLVQDYSSGVYTGKLSGSGSIEELHGQHAILKECIEKLTALESSRASLVSHVRDFLQEQELKLDRLRSQLQAAQLQSDRAANVCGLHINSNIQLDEEGLSRPPGFTTAPAVVYTRQVSLPDNKAAPSEDDPRRSAAVDITAKFSASTSSGDNSNSNSNGDYVEYQREWKQEKKPKFENGSSFYSSPPPLPPTPPPLLPPPPLDQLPPPPPLDQLPPPPPLDQLPPPPPLPPTPPPLDQLPPPPPPYSPLGHMTPGVQVPPPPSSPHSLPPMPSIMLPYPMPPQFIQTAGSMPNMSYNYGPPPPVGGPGYPIAGPPVTGMLPYGHPVYQYQNYQVSEGGFYNPSSGPMPPMPPQQRL